MISAPAQRPIGEKLFAHLKNEIDNPAITWNEFLPMIEKIGWNNEQALQLKSLNKTEFMSFCSRLNISPYIKRVEKTLPAEGLPLGMKAFKHLEKKTGKGDILWAEFLPFILTSGWKFFDTDKSGAYRVWQEADSDKTEGDLGGLGIDEFLRFCNCEEVREDIKLLESRLPSTTWFTSDGSEPLDKCYTWSYEGEEKNVKHELELEEIKLEVTPKEEEPKGRKFGLQRKEPEWYNEICERDVDQELCDEAAKNLRTALKSFKTNYKSIVTVMGSKSIAEIQAIRQSYSEKIKRNLIKDFKSKTSGSFQNLVMSLTMGQAEYDATLIRNALKERSTNVPILTEVLATRSAAEITAMSTQYPQLFKGRDMMTDIKNNTSGDLRKIYINLCEGKRTMGSSMVNPKEEVEFN